MLTPGNPLAAFAAVIAGAKTLNRKAADLLGPDRLVSLDWQEGAEPCPRDDDQTAAFRANRSALAALPRAVDEGAVEALAKWNAFTWCNTREPKTQDEMDRHWTLVHPGIVQGYMAQARAILTSLTPPEPGR